MYRRALLLAVFASAVWGVLTPAAAGGGDPAEYPPALEGIWECTFIQRDCSSDVIVQQFTILDTICAGEPQEVGDLPVDCEGEFTDQGFESTCTGVVTEDCTFTYTVTTSGTIDGDTFSWTSESVVEVSGGKGCDFGPFCTRFDVTCAKIGEATCEATPADEKSWGEVKSTFH